MDDPETLGFPQTPIREIRLFPCADWSEGEEIPCSWAKLRTLGGEKGRMISLQLISKSLAKLHELRLPGAWGEG